MNPDSSQTQSGLDPLVLFVPIIVLGRSQGMSDTLQRIHNGASQIIGRIGLVGSSTPMMRLQVLSKQNRISQGSIVRVHVNLGTETPSCTFFLARVHHQKLFLGFFWRLVAVFTLDSIRALLLHLLLGSIVHVGCTIFNHTHGITINGPKVIGSIGHDIGIDSQQFQIFHNGLLVLFLFLGRIGIIKSHNESPLVATSIVIIEQDSLGMSNVQITRRFGWETSDNITGDGTLQ
mmetsp:Transcript_4352/g.10191  ORF Transcript_4352/g.10191 Transcript_4352/m.10191 type:complete len:233 (-) Transcript_4352:938-1636(-)